MQVTVKYTSIVFTFCVLVLAGCTVTQQLTLAKGDRHIHCRLTPSPVRMRDFVCNASVLATYGLLEASVEVLVRGMQQYGEQPVLLKMLGRILLMAGMPAEAKMYLSRAEKRAPGDAEIKNLLRETDSARKQDVELEHKTVPEKR